MEDSIFGLFQTLSIVYLVAGDSVWELSFVIVIIIVGSTIDVKKIPTSVSIPF